MDDIIKTIDKQTTPDPSQKSQKLMAKFFDVDVRTVNEHLKNNYDPEELTREALNALLKGVIIRTGIGLKSINGG